MTELGMKRGQDGVDTCYKRPKTTVLTQLFISDKISNSISPRDDAIVAKTRPSSNVLSSVK